MTTRQEFNTDPGANRHHGMMVQMEKRNLIHFFPQNEKYLQNESEIWIGLQEYQPYRATRLSYKGSTAILLGPSGKQN